MILAGDDAEQRARMIGKLLREARPDDAFHFLTPNDIRAEWPRIERDLGRRREFWRWLLDEWERMGVA
ncbi:hypothetical protein [Engelhardtia mirabilis]|uniref:Uncharacterized protein n=1 Tax=Engelhardtia mirabilis TaxID=2528011 RepID=A0A518BS41_9BACT|nr:hypothetical protein Pla133_49110 [Planctomycetes bacterium Pla133]QDV04115.1 hypothetical protein Pla86_49090 [Planctomycetes bacterium Pla86]